MTGEEKPKIPDGEIERINEEEKKKKREEDRPHAPPPEPPSVEKIDVQTPGKKQDEEESDDVYDQFDAYKGIRTEI